jgi:signal transduction histidine kinase
MGALSNPGGETRDLSSLAHELANLVQVVSGNLELLDGRVLDEPSRRYLANARLAATHLTELSRVLSAQARS